MVVLQRSRCVGGFLEEDGFSRSVGGEFSGFLLVSSPGGVHKGEGDLWICSGWPPPVSPQVWSFVSLLCWVLLSFRCPWQKPQPRLAGGQRRAWVADLATMCCRRWVGWWLKRKGGRTAVVKAAVTGGGKEKNKGRRRNRRKEERRKERKKKGKGKKNNWFVIFPFFLFLSRQLFFNFLFCLQLLF